MSQEKKSATAATKINVNDPQSPYYLCSSDHPGNIISPTVLTGDKYANWSQGVTNASKWKNKLVFVNGTLAKPGRNVTLRLWPGYTMLLTRTSMVLWPMPMPRSDLKERYSSQGNEIGIHHLRRQITITIQGNLSVTDYFIKLKTLWDEPCPYLTLPNYSCRKEFNLIQIR